MLLMIVLSFSLTACHSTYDPEEIRETTDFKDWIPDSAPDGYELTSSEVDPDWMFLSFQNGEKYVEMSASQDDRFVDIALKNYIRHDTEPEEYLYEVIETDEFVGILDTSTKKNQDVHIYTFVSRQDAEDHSIDHYHKVHTNAGEERFQALLDSME